MSNETNRYNIQQNMVRPEAVKQAITVRPMSEAESRVFSGLTQASNQPQPIQMPALPTATNSAHMRENFDMRAMAHVARTFGKDDALIVGGITLVLTIGIYWFVPGDTVTYALGWLLAWGSISLFAMNRTRLQALNHSPAGVARLEQKTQAQMHNRSAQVEEYRIDADKAVRLAEVQTKRELGLAMLNRLESKRDE